MEPFLCYLFNTYPELPKLIESLDMVARCILERHQMDSVTRPVEDYIPDVEEFLLTRDGRFLPKLLQRIETRGLCENPLSLSTHQLKV